MRVTKAPTEGSFHWMKSVSGVSGSKTARQQQDQQQHDQQQQPDGIIDVNRLQKLGLGKLAEKMGQNL